MSETREQIEALREAYVAGRISEWHLCNGTGAYGRLDRDGRDEARRKAAATRYPLVEVRVEPDPEPGCATAWRCVDGALQWAAHGTASWSAPSAIRPTPARVRLWADLLAHPTKNVDTSPVEEGA